MAITLPAVYARNDEARRMVAGFAAATPTLSDPLYYLRDELNEQVLAAMPGGESR